MPCVPLGLGDALAGRQDVEALVALGAEEVPAALQVADQAVGLVLGGHADAADAGVERVREGEVDDADLAAEVDRRLGAPVGQLHEPAAAAAGQNVGHGAARKRGSGRDLGHRRFLSCRARLFWTAKLLCARVIGSSPGARRGIRQRKLPKPTGYGPMGIALALSPMGRQPEVGNDAVGERKPGALDGTFPPSAVCHAAAPHSKRLSPPSNQLKLTPAAYQRQLSTSPGVGADELPSRAPRQTLGPIV